MASNQLFVFVLVCSCLLGSAVAASAIDNIKIRLYSKDYSYIQVYAREAVKLLPNLNLSKKVLLHCHGYTQSTDTEGVVQLIRAYLDSFDYNIMAADYRNVTSGDYLSTVALMNRVSDVLTESMRTLIAGGVNPKQIIITGLSLGGQAAGRIGRHLDTKIAEIIAMDPAGPLYRFNGTSVSASDADCVKCIHTDAGFYGSSHVCGHIDFYPNRGIREQPGCRLFSFNDLLNTCSHRRSQDYMTEAARHPNSFLSIKCNSWNNFTAGRCDKSVVIPMGEAAPCNVEGLFYLQTNSNSPFGKGRAGTVYSG